MRSIKHMFWYVGLVLLVYLVVGCSGQEASATTENTNNPHYPAIYIAPSEDEALVQPNTLNKYGITFIQTDDDLAAAIEGIDVIYLHPDAVDLVDANILKDAYQRGTTIVAINTPITKLAKILGAATPLEDLRPLDVGIYISLFHHAFDPTTQRITGGGSHTEYYPDFDIVVEGVNGLLRLNHKQPSQQEVSQ